MTWLANERAVKTGGWLAERRPSVELGARAIVVRGGYPIRDRLKSMGFTFEVEEWRYPVCKAVNVEHLQGIVEELRRLGAEVEDERLMERIKAEWARQLRVCRMAEEYLREHSIPVESVEEVLTSPYASHQVWFKLPKLGRERFKEVMRKLEKLDGEYRGEGWFRVPIKPDTELWRKMLEALEVVRSP